MSKRWLSNARNTTLSAEDGRTWGRTWEHTRECLWVWWACLTAPSASIARPATTTWHSTWRAITCSSPRRCTRVAPGSMALPQAEENRSDATIASMPRAVTQIWRFTCFSVTSLPLYLLGVPKTSYQHAAKARVHMLNTNSQDSLCLEILFLVVSF